MGDLEAMTNERFDSHIKHRPLRLVIEQSRKRDDDKLLSKDSGRQVVAEVSDARLGMILDSAPPGRLLVVRIKPGSWAERLGIRSGSCVVSGNGEELLHMPSEV